LFKGYRGALAGMVLQHDLAYSRPTTKISSAQIQR
jgi:hypothetical protein